MPTLPDIRYPNFAFDIIHRAQGSRARLGLLKTPHGVVETPNFIFCGTKAAIKSMDPFQLKGMGAQIMLSNTYHLMIQPGADLVEKMGGLHAFTRWDGPMLTDSGGFQIFAMGEGTVANELKARSTQKRERTLIKITEQGATFRSYMDGKVFNLTPEDSMRIQRQLGADLVVQLDECTATHESREYTAKSMAMSHRWGDRSLQEFARTDDGRQAVYGVVQGGVFEDLRRESAAYTKDRPFFGTAIGGAFGTQQAEFLDVVRWSMDDIHMDRPVHLLGIGSFRDIFECVKMGADTFDCVSPTRIARHGWALMKGVPGGRLNMRNARYRDDPDALCEGLPGSLSGEFSKAYIHHLIKAGEMLGLQILTQHNVAVMVKLLREVREAVRTGTLDALQKEWIVD